MTAQSLSVYTFHRKTTYKWFAFIFIENVFQLRTTAYFVFSVLFKSRTWRSTKIMGVVFLGTHELKPNSFGYFHEKGSGHFVLLTISEFVVKTAS